MIGYISYEFYNSLGYLLILVGVVLTIGAQALVSTRYNKYKRVGAKNNMSGVEVARYILDKAGLNDVYVTEVRGTMSDHYDPTRKTVRLSTEVFHGSTIAAYSIAAHECGHAIQHKEGYFFIKLRGAIIPFVNFASRFGYIAIFIGLIFGFMDLAWAGIGLLLFILFFQLITLPTEFNASSRALEILKSEKLLDSSEIDGSKKVLGAAAMTYVASLATTIFEILRLVLMVASNDDRR